MSPSPSSLSLCLRQCQPGVCSLLPAHAAIAAIPPATSTSHLRPQATTPTPISLQPSHQPATSRRLPTAHGHHLSHTAHSTHRARAEEGTGASSTPMSMSTGEQGDPRSIQRGSLFAPRFLLVPRAPVCVRPGTDPDPGGLGTVRLRWSPAYMRARSAVDRWQAQTQALLPLPAACEYQGLPAGAVDRT